MTPSAMFVMKTIESADREMVRMEEGDPGTFIATCARDAFGENNPKFERKYRPI